MGGGGEVRKKQSSNKQVRKNKFGDRGLGIPRVSNSAEILGLLGPTRHRKSMISLRKIEVFGYGAPASGSEAALGALTCSGWASGGVPGLILDPPGGPFGAFGSRGKCEKNKVRINKFEKTSLGTGGWASRGFQIAPRSWAYSGLLGIENQ